MRKLITILCLTFTFNFGIMASPVNVGDINQQITELLQPIQNERTEASLNLKSIDIDTIRANHLALSAYLLKKSDTNKLELNLSNLDYENTQGTSPILSLAFSLGTDFTQIFSQETLNEEIPNLKHFILNLVNDQISIDLGDAFTINVVVSDIGKDNDDNYTSLSAIINAKIDFSKLPEDITSQEIMFKDLVISLKLDVKKGCELNGYININPEYASFQKDETGLKEILENIIAHDENELEKFTFYIFFLNDMAEAILKSNLPDFSPHL